jgi:hypothetical protein
MIARCDVCGRTWVVVCGPEHLDGLAHRMVGGATLSDCPGVIHVSLGDNGLQSPGDTETTGRHDQGEAA